MNTTDEAGLVPVRQLGQVLTERVDEIQRRYQRGNLAQLATGLADLDELIGPADSQRPIVVASGPSVGRTSLVLQMALTQAAAGAVPLWLSNTLTTDEVAERALAIESEVPIDRLRDGRLSGPDWARVGRVIGRSIPEMLVADCVETARDLETVVDRIVTPAGPANAVFVDGIERLLGVERALGGDPYDALRRIVFQHSVPWAFTMRLDAKLSAWTAARVAHLLDEIPEWFAATILVLEPALGVGGVVARVVRSPIGRTGVVDLMRRSGSPRFYGRVGR